MSFEGRTYSVVMGSDVDRDGMFLELNDTTLSEGCTVAEWFYSDVDGSMELTMYQETIPPAVLAWFRDEAAKCLPPRPDAV
jgi:hypothetical protein